MQVQHLDGISNLLGRSITPVRLMRNALNAAVIEMPPAEAQRVRAADSVAVVRPTGIHARATDLGPQFDDTGYHIQNPLGAGVRSPPWTGAGSYILAYAAPISVAVVGVSKQLSIALSKKESSLWLRRRCTTQPVS